jgi:hypothetical protein
MSRKLKRYDREVQNSAAVAWLRAVRETLSLTRREFIELLNKTIASTTASDPEHFPLRTISETMYRNYEAGRLRVPFFVRSAVELVEAEYKEKIGSNSNEEVEPPQFLEQIQSLEEMVRISKEQRGGGKRVIEYAKAVEQAGLVTSTEAGTDDTDKAVEEEQLHYPELYREWERIDEVIATTKHKLSNIDEASRRIDRRLALLRSQMPHD